MTPHALLALELLGYGLGALLIGLLIGRYAAPSVRAVAAAPGDELAGELNRMWEAGYDQGYQEGRHDGRDERPSAAVHRPDSGDDPARDAGGGEERGYAGSDGSEDPGEGEQDSEWEPAATDLIARQARYHQPEPPTRIDQPRGLTRSRRITDLASLYQWLGEMQTFSADWHEEAFRAAEWHDREWLPGYVGWLEDAKKASWTDRLIREGM